VSFNGKCLNRNIAAFFDIFRECALSYDFNDLDRLKSLLLEYRAGLESSVVQNGHALAISLSTRNFSTSCHLSELWNGVTQLKMIKSYCERMVDPASEKDVLSELSGMFAKIAGHLFSNGNFRFALVGEEEALTAAEKNIGDFANVLAVTPETPLPRFSMRMDSALVREGWSTNTAVSFVGASIPTVTLGHPDAPVLAVISKILKSNYLHREIREKGGAYGGFAIYNSEDGIFSFGSYRDPHIINTLNVFEQAADFFTSNGIEDDDVTEAILQVCSAIDKPETPGPAARKAFYRDIVGLSDEIRREYKTRLLSVTKKDIEAAALRYFGSNAGSQSVAVISGEEKLQEANRKLGEKTLTLNRI
jgi:Zn-dependent M16 (insulinase) family peptidase